MKKLGYIFTLVLFLWGSAGFASDSDNYSNDIGSCHIQGKTKSYRDENYTNIFYFNITANQKEGRLLFSKFSKEYSLATSTDFQKNRENLITSAENEAKTNPECILSK